MQNPQFNKYECDAILRFHPDTEILEGNAYCPVLGVRLLKLEMPKDVCENTIDVTIPFARCGGYLPGSSLAGLHFSQPLHAMYQGEKTIIPFCDPVEDFIWMDSTERFYPLYEEHKEELMGTGYLCLNNPEEQTESPIQLLTEALDFLNNWTDYVMELATQHGAISRGLLPGNIEESNDWIDHLVEHASPNLKRDLISASQALVF